MGMDIFIILMLYKGSPIEKGQTSHYHPFLGPIRCRDFGHDENHPPVPTG